MNPLCQLYGLASDRAASLTGLKGRARRAAEIVRSNAIQMERIRCVGLTDEELLARLAEVSRG